LALLVSSAVGAAAGSAGAGTKPRVSIPKKDEGVESLPAWRRNSGLGLLRRNVPIGHAEADREAHRIAGRDGDVDADTSGCDAGDSEPSPTESAPE
jgi:hypothetical protein